MRWSEEVLLLKEEMERVQRFFHWKADSWDELVLQPPLKLKHDDAITDEGRKAYARRQALMFRAMEARCERMWSVVPPILQGCQLYQADYTPGKSADK
jgi:hypothetical protein